MSQLKLLALIQSNIDTMLKLQAEGVEKDAKIKELTNDLEAFGQYNRKVITQSSEIRKMLIRYNESLFFKLFKLWLWIGRRYQHSKLRAILDRSYGI